MQDVVIWSRQHKRLPDILDRHDQYSWYKSEPNQSLIDHFFKETDQYIYTGDWFELTEAKEELQFTDYKLLNFDMIAQFRDKYFMPSQYILDKVAFLEDKYKIDYENTCGVLYRGNDKNRETNIAGYDQFILKAMRQWLDMTVIPEGDCTYTEIVGLPNKPCFLVAPDETEFLDAFKHSMPDYALCMEETAHMPKKDSCIPLELPYAERAEQAANFFATVLMLSKCKYLITHSGNVSLWACIYRGHMNGVSQWLNGSWI